ncbi:MAG: gliding motility-associated C-terminal domain-containing protein [Flavobacteriales bacterium]
MKLTLIQLKPLLILLVVLVSTSLFHAQENCSNGIDDDGDGLIDGFDPECYTTPDCYVEGEEGDFTLTAPGIHCSAIFIAPSAYSSPIAGDVDGDGDVEVLVINYALNRLMVISGVDCSLEAQIPFDPPAFDSKAGNIVIGDVDSDGYTDIFVAYGRGALDPFAIRRIEYDGSDYQTIWDTDNVATADRKHLDIVDINQDGQPEIIPNGGFMVNAVTGVLYSGALPTIDEDGRGLYAFSAAADFGNNGNEGEVELIVGSSIYRYDFVLDVWNLIRQIPTHTSNYWGEFSKTALADLDLDGDLDAFVSAHQLGEYMAWDLQTNTILGFGDTGLGIDPSLGLSRASIGNLDDDAYPEIVMVYRNSLIAIEDIINSNASITGFTNLWDLATTDGSGHTQATLFDFDSDGKKEIVYRDVSALRIFRGDDDSGGVEEIYNSGPNSITSETGMEYPIIVDANGDGRANILTISDSNGSYGEGLHVFESTGEPWAKAREIWNTQAYSTTNVNDDGTIPAIAQENHIVYNDYLTQHAPFTMLPENHIASPDLVMSVDLSEGINGIIYDNCPDYGIALEICNEGDADSTNDFNIEVYDGDPNTDASAVLVSTHTVTSSVLEDGCITQTIAFTPNVGTSNEFHFFINHVDTSPSYPITPSLVERTVIECDYSNNELIHSFSCNRPPSLVDDNIIICSSALQSIDVLANDTDLDGNLDASTLTILTAPTQGTVAVSGTEIDFTANGGFVGLDSLEYAVSDTGLPVHTESAWLYFDIQAGSDAGVSSTVNVCSASGLVELITLLGGTPDNGGSWTDGNGNPHSSDFDPSFEDSQILTYDFSAISGCPGNLATVDLTVVDFSEAGTGSTVTLCSSSNSVNMYTLLTGSNDSSGDWFNDADVLVSSLFVPGTTPAGDYIYVVSQTAPCAADTAFLTINIEQELNPGDNGTLGICETAPDVNLYNQLLNSPEAGGTWTAPNGLAHSGILAPSSLLNGNYEYELAATANCPAISSLIQVDITPTADPGSNSALNICDIDSPTNLIDHLIGTPDAGGDWTDPNGDPHDGSLDPSVAINGIYTYTIDLNAPCSNVSAQLNVSIDNSFNAGTNASVTLCDGGSSEVILGLLGGTPDANGVWSLGGSNITMNNFDPQIDLAGVYTYTVPANGVCEALSSDLIIQIDSQPNAGDNTIVQICNYDTSVLLTSLLEGNPDTNGDWFDENDQAISSSINSSTDGVFNFMHVVNGTATCQNDTSYLEVTIQEQLSAGSGLDFFVCENGISINLNDSISADALTGGNWHTPANATFDGVLDPQTALSGNYIYEVVSPASCNNLTSSFNVQIEELPDAGVSGGTVFFCNAFPGFDLFSGVNGTPQTEGYFTNPDGEVVNDFTTSSGQPSGVYTYHAISSGGCPETTSTINVAVNDIGSTGIDTEVTLCDNIGEVDLTALLDGTPYDDGQWLDENNNPISNLYTPTTNIQLTYRRNGGFPCPTISSDLEITLSEMTYAGDDSSINTCETAPQYNMEDYLSVGASLAGYWQNPEGTVIASSIIDPGASVPGDYLYLTTPNAQCPQDTAVISVAIQALPNAGEDGFLLVCSLSEPVTLIDYLEGSPDDDGIWIAPDNSTTDPVFDPNSGIPGQYTYQVIGTAPCPTTAATASVQVVTAPYSGADQLIELCETDNAINLEDYKEVNVTPDNYWIDNEENPVVPFEDPSDLIGGIYYLVAPGDAPCINDTTAFTVNVSQLAVANVTDVVLCTEGEEIDLLDYVLLENAESFEWKDEELVEFDGLIDPSIEESQNAWVVANSFNPCPSDSALISITINSPADPGIDTLINVCSLDPELNMFDVLGGSPDIGGSFVWLEDTLLSIQFDPALQTGTHIIEYIAPEVAPCASYSSWLQIDVYQSPDPEFSVDDSESDLSDPYYTFENETVGSYNFNWDFDGLGVASTYNSEFTFPENISDEYLVCLTASDVIGCTAEVCEMVEVKDVFTHFIPNSFTPNGDGDNDIFFIRGRGIDTDFFNLMLYSRNGDLVFETNDPLEGWDGTWFGEDVPTDIYSFRLIIKAKDTSERKEIMGHITLMR